MAVDDSPHSHAAWLFVLHNILKNDDKVVLLHGVTTNVQVGSAENPGGGFIHAPGAASTGAGELYIMKSQLEESSRLQQSYIDVAFTAASCKVTSVSRLPFPRSRVYGGASCETITLREGCAVASPSP